MWVECFRNWLYQFQLRVLYKLYSTVKVITVQNQLFLILYRFRVPSERKRPSRHHRQETITMQSVMSSIVAFNLA